MIDNIKYQFEKAKKPIGIVYEGTVSQLTFEIVYSDLGDTRVITTAVCSAPDGKTYVGNAIANNFSNVESAAVNARYEAIQAFERKRHVKVVE